MKKFRCKICGYVHEGDAAPDACPLCKAPASEFVELTEEGAPAPNAKKRLNKNSNVYTLIYMVVMVAIVSLLLSITSGSLKETQNKNVKLDKMKQILSSTPEGETALMNGADAQELFASTIKEYIILDAEGNLLDSKDPVADFDYKPAEGEYPVYVADVEGAKKYIIPMNGAGLWGAIWGYVALNDDRNTIHGIFFAHASETAGLGSEIVANKFRDPFQGKKILDAQDEFMSIYIAKTGQKSPTGQEQVDNISGATVTCKGVEAMIESSLKNYAVFFAAKDAVLEIIESAQPVINEPTPEAMQEAAQQKDELPDSDNVVNTNIEGGNK